MTSEDRFIVWIDRWIMDINNYLKRPINHAIEMKDAPDFYKNNITLQRVREAYLLLKDIPHPKPKEPKDYLGKWYNFIEGNEEDDKDIYFYASYLICDQINGMCMNGEDKFIWDSVQSMEYFDTTLKECDPPQLPEGVFIYGVNV